MRSKRRKTAPRPTVKKEPSSSPTPSSPLTLSIQPLQDALTSRYAAEEAMDSSFDEIMGPLLSDYMRVKTEIETKSERDEHVGL